MENKFEIKFRAMFIFLEVFEAPRVVIFCNSSLQYESSQTMTYGKELELSANSSGRAV
jgi:hypothetical protein